MSALRQLSSTQQAAPVAVNVEAELSPTDFHQIAEIVMGNCGIMLPASKIGLVRTRLQGRIRKLGIDTYAKYVALLKSPAGAEELPELISVISTNVTSFNREPHHFEHFRAHVVPSLVQKLSRGQEVRIWSAGCSNGSEPYTIACAVKEAMPNVNNAKFKILATDIDQHSLSIGRSGLYPEDMVSKMESVLLKKYFTETNGKFQIANDVMKMVSFKQLNLMNPWPMKKSYDAIFCRNVMIYFSQENQERLMQKFADRLNTGAFFYIGHSERMAGPAADQFNSVGSTTYQKR